MRLSELLDREVVDASGDHIGRVHDVRLRQELRPGTTYEGPLQLEGLIVGRGGFARRLGYGRTGSRGPWVIRRLLESSKRSFVPWSSVRAIDATRIHVGGRADELSPVVSLPDARRESET